MSCRRSSARCLWRTSLKGAASRRLRAKPALASIRYCRENGMPCCIFVSGCKAFTTNLQKSEDLVMGRKFIWTAPATFLGMVLFVVIGGEAVLHLWNWLLP